MAAISNASAAAAKDVAAVLCAALTCTGFISGASWACAAGTKRTSRRKARSIPGLPLDAFDAKADALAALAAVGAPTENLQVDAEAAPGWYHPGRSGALMLGPKPLAFFGEVHPAVVRDFELRGAVSAFEVIMGAVPPARAKKSAARSFLALAVLQSAERDFAFIVDADVEAAQLVRAAAGADKNLISGVELFDVYQGAELGDNKKSLAIAVTLQPTEATLTDAEIDKASEKIVAAVTKATGGVLRG